MVRVFISQPMAGKSQSEIEDERDAAFAEVACMYAEKGHDCSEVPSYIPSLAVQMPPLYCLGVSIQLMADADVAVFCGGWQDARGCRIEHECATAYGIDVIELV